MNRFLSLSALITGFSIATLSAAMIEPYSSGVINAAIPDGNPSGLLDVITVTDSEITEIEDISVSLKIQGTWNGDLYVTLQHSTGFAVLLNRVGRTSGNAFGTGDAGFNVTLNDNSALTDIHAAAAAGGLLLGDFASDGRLVDPDLVVDTDARTAFLTSFNGTDANGDWNLFVADLSGGNSQVLESWELSIAGIPEPSGIICFMLGGSLLLRRKR